MRNTGRLKGKVAIITGAASGIGRAISVLFAKEGAKLVLADINDEEELNTGKRREGMYSAAYGWWLKLGLSISVLLAGILLQSTGFDAELDVQSERTLFLIRAWEIGLPSVLCFIGVVL